MRVESARLDRLTGLRFIAALAVFVFHGLLFIGGAESDVVHAVFGQGRSGVSFFFILSGFVLAWSSRPGDTILGFYRRRFARIYPAYLAALLIAGLLWLIRDPKGLANGLLTPFLLQSWVPDKHVYFAVNTPAWSLSVEAFFYLMFPFVIAALRRLYGRGLWVAGAVAVAVPIALAAVASQSLNPADLDDGSFVAWAVYYFPLARLPEFILGAVLALQFRAGLLPTISWKFAVALAATAYLAAGLWPSAFGIVALVIVPFALLIVAAAQRDIAGRRGWLGGRFSVNLGAISYCFYLVHNIFIARLAQPGFQSLGIDEWVGFGIAFVLSFVTAWALHKYVELPFDRKLGRGASLKADATASGRR